MRLGRIHQTASIRNDAGASRSVTHQVGKEGFCAGDREHDAAEADPALLAVAQEVVEAVVWGKGLRRIHTVMRSASQQQCRPEQGYLQLLKVVVQESADYMCSIQGFMAILQQGGLQC